MQLHHAIAIILGFIGLIGLASFIGFMFKGINGVFDNYDAQGNLAQHDEY